MQIISYCINKIKNGENFVILKVDNKRRKASVPTLIFDWWNFGGITRDVYILETNNIYIQNYHITLNKQNKKQINIKIELNTRISNKPIEISIPELGIFKILKTNTNGIVSDVLNPKKIILWTPKNPKLYTVILKLENEAIYDKIGFRTIEVLDKKILLNGNPIFLRGVNVHDVKPLTDGRANSYSDANSPELILNGGDFLVFLYHMENLCWIFEIGHWGLGISALIVESLANV